jgi:hypothetical protein
MKRRGVTPYELPLEVVFADGPPPHLADKLQLFGQFVGSWELEVVYHGPTGERTLSAEWHFAWALNGHAVQDVWIAPHRRDRERGEAPVDWGTTIRFYDPRIDAWRSTWIGPVKGLVLPFIARPIGDEIVLEGSFEDDKLTHWVFSQITPSSFRWRAVESNDAGRNWSLVQEMSARRIGHGPVDDARKGTIP